MRRSDHAPEVISVHTISQTSDDSDRTEDPFSPATVDSVDSKHKPECSPENNQDGIDFKRSTPGVTGDPERKRPRLGKDQCHATQNSKTRHSNVDSGSGCTSKSYGGRVRRRAIFVDGVSYRYVQRTVSRREGWVRKIDS